MNSAPSRRTEPKPLRGVWTSPASGANGTERRAVARPAPRRDAPSSPGPRPALVRLALFAVGLGLGATMAVTLTAQTRSQFDAPGGPATFLGNATGMVGSYLALVMVLLVSRIPFVERVLGQDGLLRWHRRLAPWPISLLIAHALLLTVGYAQASKAGPLHEVGTLLRYYPDMLTATVGLALMCLAGVVSIRAIRLRLRREVWWTIHLYLYLALALAFAHVIVLGQSFVGHPLTRIVWSVAWAASAGVVLAYRVGLPLVRTLRYQVTVAEVVTEGPDVVSVICTGRGLDRLVVRGGQFFYWRFLTKELWWQAHPYSVSALPQSSQLRLTVKAVGDHSAALAQIPVGTRVAIEGPYGVFTTQSQHNQRALLLAAGIGVTAVRSLLEDMPRSAKPVVVLRAGSPEDLVLADEVGDLVKRRGGTLYKLTGTRRQVPINDRSLPRLVPDLMQRDLYVCGPEGFVTEMVALFKSMGVPEEAVHHEMFAL